VQLLTPNHARKRRLDARSRLIALGTCTGGLALALLWLLLVAPAAHASACAAQNNYTGPANGAWNSEGNWSNKLPKTGETVCIPEGKGTITVAAGIKAEAKTLLAQSAVTVASTGTLAVSEKFVMEEPTANEEKATRFTDGLKIEAGGLVSTAGDWILMSGTVLLEGEIKNTSGNINEVVARLASGTLEGEGTMAIPFSNIGGTIQPGGAGTVGAMHFISHSSQGPNGTLVLDIASATSFDHFILSSEFTWFGTLDVNLLGGYEPPVGTDFEFQTGGGTIGEFEHITAGFEELPLGNDDTIRVSPRKPTVVTEEASDVTQTSAILNGSVNPNTDQVTICNFEFGAGGPPYGGSSTCPTPPGKGPSPVAETEALTNLTPGTTYHFRIVAVNHEGGESQGIDRSFTTLPASKGGEEPSKETPVEKTPVEEKSPSGGGSTTTTSGSSTTTPTIGPSTLPGAIPGPVATAPRAVEELLLGCSSSSLVLNDAYIRGGRVLLSGSAAKSLAGKRVKILFNERKQVATATVGADGQFATTAPLPPAKIREALTTRYTAEVGNVRSLHLKLTRRLLLEPPRASGTTVTLSGQVTLPLTKPVAPVVVEQQLECGKTTIVQTFTPPASGRFQITLTVPANARAGIYRLTSKVAANEHAVKHGFTTFSLPLPVTLG
jgi:uncharacterized membrane protein